MLLLQRCTCLCFVHVRLWPPCSDSVALAPAQAISALPVVQPDTGAIAGVISNKDIRIAMKHGESGFLACGCARVGRAPAGYCCVVPSPLQPLPRFTPRCEASLLLC